MNQLSKVEEAKHLFEKAFASAVAALERAKAEAFRPLTRDEILERDIQYLGDPFKDKKSWKDR